jgi:hypothetical protein
MTMGSKPNHDDEIRLDDDLGRLLKRSLEARVVRMTPPARGREQLLSAARARQNDQRQRYGSDREDYRWLPPQRRDQNSLDQDLLSAFIHARDSVRRMSL